MRNALALALHSDSASHLNSGTQTDNILQMFPNGDGYVRILSSLIPKTLGTGKTSNNNTKTLNSCFAYIQNPSQVGQNIKSYFIKAALEAKTNGKNKETVGINMLLQFVSMVQANQSS